MPIIFAQSIASLPATIGAFAGWTLESQGFGGGLMRLFDTSKPFYSVLYFLLIVGFSYFYATMQFNPIEVANNLKKNGGFVPGIRPGERTQEYIDTVLSRLTLSGAVYISAISLLPMLMIAKFNVPFYFGGTSLLILVGVAMDFMNQVESHMISTQYQGLMNKAARKGGRM